MDKGELNMKCSKCGAELANGAKFCSACGASVLPEPEVEVIPPSDEPKAEEPRKTKKVSRYSEEEIKKMRYELKDHLRRKHNFCIAGGVLLGVGLVILTLGIVFLVTSTISIAEYPEPDNGLGIAGMILSYLGVVLGALMFPCGIILLVIGNAVFGSKANNRERAIQEFEANK